ncbi:unnamed protein product [Mucor hiemalis]
MNMKLMSLQNTSKLTYYDYSVCVRINKTLIRLKWDENKLKATEKQKEQVSMKIDEPNTPYIRYNSTTDQVTNWGDIPESVRKSATEEPEDFSLDDSKEEGGISFKTDTNSQIKDEWERADEHEQREKEEEALRRHREFEERRNRHYSHNGDVLHSQLDDLN